MRSARGSSRARARIALVVLGGALALACVGVASAAVLDRAVARWVRGVESALAFIAAAVPPIPPAPPTLGGARLRGTPSVTSWHRAQRDLAPRAPDERLDAVRAAFCPEAARRLCAARQRCGCVYAEPDCVDRLEQACSNRLFQSFELQADQLELAPAVLDRCLEGFSALPTHCQLASAIVHGCAWPVRDDAVLGAECAGASIRCRDGACVSERCEVLPRTGELAVVGICLLTDVPVDSLCRASVGIGDACESYLQCADGLGDCELGRCVYRGQHGHACDSTWECDAGLACTNGRCAEPPTWCVSGVDCGADHECVRPPSQCRACSGDEACGGTMRCNDGHRCGDGFSCEEPADEGRCQPLVCQTASLEALFGDLH